jgi:hypothetical protein
MGHVQSGEKLECLTQPFPAKVGRPPLPSYFSSQTANEWPLLGLVSATLSFFDDFAV